MMTIQTRRIRLLSLILIFVSTLASADLFNPSPSPEASSWGGPGGQKAQCDNYCNMLVNGKGQILGLNGNTGWTVADDQWCADHGSQTNPLIGVNPTPTSAAAPPNVQCPNATMINGDTSCSTTQEKLLHCQWHNGQVEQQCEAYEAAGGAHPGEVTVMALDIAAAGACGVACATGGVHPATVAACRDVGLAASTAELIATLTQKSSAVGKIASAAMSVIGIAMQVSHSTGGLTGFLKGDSKPSTNSGGSKKKDDKQSCMSAVMFGAMAGVRAGMIKSQGDTQKSACQSVLSLASQTSTAGYASLAPGGSGSGSAVAGTSTGMSASGDAGVQCVGSGGSVSSCSGASAAAPDVSALQNSGLGQQVAGAAQQLAASPMGQALASGNGDVGQAVGAAGGGSTGDAGSAVATVASAAQAHAMELSDGVEGTAFGGGGGGGGGGDGEAAPNPMAALAGLLNPQGKDQAPMGGTLKFGGAPQNTDIYHKSSNESLFGIVSGAYKNFSGSVQ